MGACCGNDKEYQTTTKFYCHTCLVEHFERPKQVRKWDNTPCLACGETLLDKGMWNDIFERGRIDFEYCNNCNFIYNPPPCMIYTIPEEKEPISSCASESELLINRDPDSDDDDKNTSSSSVQNDNNNKNNSNSDSNSNLNYEQYIALPDLSKEQELKWYSDKGEGIMPEHAHDTDAEFDLRYPEKEAIKLEPHSRICIDLKVALEILATTMI
ncbi:hypothetical protein G9A89_021908 [Geosiphon pyriformis]|nr:hypothetical protein G9A89_021908 [Geosiphon pyriformis]